MNEIMTSASAWVGVGALIIGICGALYAFFKMPREKQKEMVKQWLLYAVLAAEQNLGSETGQLKLLEVYNEFVRVFPQVAKVVSFDTFSEWVDEALAKIQKLLVENDVIREVIETGGAQDER